MKIYRKILVILFTLNLCAIGYFTVEFVKKSVLEEIRIVAGKTADFDFNIPASAFVRQNDIENSTVSVVNMNSPFSITAAKEGNYVMDVKLFGMIHLKEVNINVTEEKYIVPCGMPIGIYIKMDGVYVIDSGVVTGSDGLNYEPCKNILRSGDYIIAINHIEIENKNQLSEILNQTQLDKVVLTVNRNNKQIEVSVKPIEIGKNQYKIGAWVRDDLQGIGTLTFISENEFGALGHGINDIDTNQLVNIKGASCIL